MKNIRMDKVYITNTPNTEKGLFTYQEILKKDESTRNNSIQIDKNTYLKDVDETIRFINHSCDPNGWIKITKNGVFLVALRDITEGEELTFDYSITMDEDNWEMNCNCQSIKCRKRIQDFKYLSETIQQEYIKKRIVPKYVLSGLKSKLRLVIETKVKN